MQLSCTTRATSRPYVASRRQAVQVKAFFGGSPDSKKEAAKDAAFEAQQAILAARRAKKDAIMNSMGRKEARGQKSAPAPPAPSRKSQAQVYVEEDSDNEEAPKSSNPISGLLGGLFGKK